ncbi:MAG: hypothetical protein WCA60_00415 [Methanoregula sp.]
MPSSCFRSNLTGIGFHVVPLRLHHATQAILEIYTPDPATLESGASCRDCGTILEKVTTMKHTKIMLLGSFCMICLMAAVMPAGATGVTPDSWNTNASHIAAMQATVAYAGAYGEAQMNGAISYIGSISNGAGTSELTSLETDFSGVVTSVESMTSADQIRQAASQMSSDKKEFMTDAKDELKEYNGTGKALHESVNASVEAQATTLATLKSTAWTDRETARMAEFATNDQNRNNILTKLSGKGIDVSNAQAVESQIQQEGQALQTGFNDQNAQEVKAANQQLSILTTQFREIVQKDRQSLRATPTVTTTSAVQG